MLERAIDNQGNLPGHIFQMVERFRHLLGLFLRELLQCIDRKVGVAFQHLGKLGFVMTGKPGGCFQ